MPGETTGATSDLSNGTSAQQTLQNLTNGAHLKQKRARSQLSCIPCRQGKLKCNRARDPACDQCIKRNREGQCLWVPPPSKQKPTQNVKGRIRQLENLVVDLMNQQNHKSGQLNGEQRDAQRKESDGGTIDANGDSGTSSGQPTPPSDSDLPSHRHGSSASAEGHDIEGATKPFGQMRISKNEISYVGETHWQAILNGISDLKRELGEERETGEEQGHGHEEDAEPKNLYGNAFGNITLSELPGSGMGAMPPTSTTGIGFMLGTAATVTREQLIASVPEKKVADRLLSLWFNSPDPFKPIIHAPAFQDEYRKFWKAPNETSTMWLGLLFAILSLAASFGLRDIDPSSPKAKTILAEVTKYHSLSAAAAVLGDFTKPKQYTIECLILYAAGLRSNDAFVNVWLMIGLVIRLGLRMGYHRDPANYPAISVFHGEMRRRVWAIISMIDTLISFQLGLPSMVKTILSDTQPPRNLLDRDFNVNTEVLPPNRPIDELTPSSYTRAKLRITRVFAEASELSHSTIAAPMEKIKELDGQLEEAKSQVPPMLQMPDISELVTDPAEQLMCRFNIDLLYLKTKIVLHRRHMEKPFAQLTPAEQAIGIGESRKACTSAALRVLQHHHTIYNASQAGGQLETIKWYMGSISTHDFLLAAMVVCLELSQQVNDTDVVHPIEKLCPQRMAMIQALEASQKIWADTSSRKRRPTQFIGSDPHAGGEHMFNETEKASRAMAVMLEKVKARFPQQANSLSQTSEDPSPQSMPTTSDYSDSARRTMQWYAHTPSGDPPAFGGMVSNYQWGNMTGVPESLAGLSSTNSPALSTLNGTSSSANDLSPTAQQQPQQQQPQQQPDPSLQNSASTELADFSLIGDMLDQNGNIDWEMFDVGVTTRGAPLSSTNQNFNLNTNQSNPFDLGVNMPIVAGNAIMGEGTGPGSGHVFPGSWMMEDVDFDMGDVTAADIAGLNGNDNGSGLW